VRKTETVHRTQLESENLTCAILHRHLSSNLFILLFIYLMFKDKLAVQ